MAPRRRHIEQVQWRGSTSPLGRCNSSCTAPQWHDALWIGLIFNNSFPPLQDIRGKRQAADARNAEDTRPQHGRSIHANSQSDVASLSIFVVLGVLCLRRLNKPKDIAVWIFAIELPAIRLGALRDKEESGCKHESGRKSVCVFDTETGVQVFPSIECCLVPLDEG